MSYSHPIVLTSQALWMGAFIRPVLTLVMKLFPSCLTTPPCLIQFASSWCRLPHESAENRRISLSFFRMYQLRRFNVIPYIFFEAHVRSFQIRITVWLKRNQNRWHFSTFQWLGIQNLKWKFWSKVWKPNSSHINISNLIILLAGLPYKHAVIVLFTVFKHMSQGHCFANKSFQFLNCMPASFHFWMLFRFGNNANQFRNCLRNSKHHYKGISRSNKNQIIICRVVLKRIPGNTGRPKSLALEA